MRFNVRANYNGTYPENVLTASASYFAVTTSVAAIAILLMLLWIKGPFIHMHTPMI